MKRACHRPGSGSRQGSHQQRKNRIHILVQYHHRADAAAQGKAAVHSQVGNIQQPVGDIDPQHHDPPENALCHGSLHR